MLKHTSLCNFCQALPSEPRLAADVPLRPCVAPDPDPARGASEEPHSPSGIVRSRPMTMSRRVRPLSVLPPLPGPAGAARREPCRDVDDTSAANAHAADVTSQAEEACSAM